ncbi:hypothetical protein V6O07_02045 [Arthrospira platensis SPKY2]
MVQLKIGDGNDDDENKTLSLKVDLNEINEKQLLYAKKLALKRGDTLIFSIIITIFCFTTIEPLFNFINNIYNKDKIEQIVQKEEEIKNKEEEESQEEKNQTSNNTELSEGIKIIERLKELNHEIYENNIVYIMNNECKKKDSWCDTLFIVTKDGKIKYRATGTVQPGSDVYRRPLNPQGVFQIIEGQHKNKWNIGQHCGAYSGKCHEALKQIAPIKGTRSQTENRDKIIEVEGIFGINIHGGLNNPSPSSPVGLNSAGCLVTKSMNDHRRFMNEIKKINEKTFTVSVISM